VHVELAAMRLHEAIERPTIAPLSRGKKPIIAAVRKPGLIARADRMC
jgi:hypothetical protein